jgi:catechol 2,3-dioxygenase-like lactoylglutathione lyase family enzyme
MDASSLDHVALWVADREALGRFLCDHLGVHEISRGDDFTLLGADARQGKLTLFDADGPREPGVLGPIVLRVADLDAALARLPDTLEVDRPAPGLAIFEAPGGLRLGLVEAAGAGPDYDLDHVVLRVPDPARTSGELAELGFAPDGDGRLAVADRHVRLEPGSAGANGRPLLNHVALLVESSGAVEDEASRRGLEVDRVVDAENTRAVFVCGPDGILLEYVEHKPGFALV